MVITDNFLSLLYVFLKSYTSPHKPLWGLLLFLRREDFFPFSFCLLSTGTPDHDAPIIIFCVMLRSRARRHLKIKIQDNL